MNGFELAFSIQKVKGGGFDATCYTRTIRAEANDIDSLKAEIVKATQRYYYRSGETKPTKLKLFSSYLREGGVEYLDFDHDYDKAKVTA